MMGNNEYKNCFIEFLEYCFNMLYDTSIFYDETIIREEIEKNRQKLRNASIEKRKLIVDSMSEIMDSDQKLNKIGKYYLAQIDDPINRRLFVKKIVTDFKFDYYRIRFFAVLKALLIIFQLYVSIVIVNSKNKNVKLWLKIDALLFLKILYFCCFDFEKIILDLYFSKTLKKIKCNKYLVICYQTLGHILNLASYIILIINTKNSEIKKPDGNGFRKETLEIISIISLDLVKFLMK